MLVRPKRAAKPVKKASFEKQLQLVIKEAERLEAHIRDLEKTLARGNYRML
jgi:ribosomal protein S15P/S13E